jgi:eukaryotic-like serine/threonine-protein kinase
LPNAETRDRFVATSGLISLAVPQRQRSCQNGSKKVLKPGFNWFLRKLRVANVEKQRYFYEFGSFRIDRDRRQLLRQNQPVPLQPKAFDILLVLVENSEKVVLKDELLKSVWPDTFVEESNLSQHIFVLRKALSDGVEKNRYIVTVPGRGYRFGEKVTVAAVSEVISIQGPRELTADEDTLVLASHTRSRMLVEERQVPIKALPAPQHHWRRVVAGGFCLAAVLAVAYFLRSRSAHRLTQQDTVVLADFTNRTGDPVFDDTLKTALGIALDQSPFLSTLSDSRAHKTLRLMARPADTKITSDVAREICQRAGAKAYIAGSIVQLGTEYVLTLQALNCQTGDTMAQEQTHSTSKEKVLDALGAAATRLRRALGESLASVQKFDATLPQATTTSLEALKAYSLGNKFFYQRDLASAPPYFQRAIELDPNFAMAYVQLGLTYYSLGEPGRASESFSKAFSLEQHANEREKMEIDALYYAYATGELDKAIHALEQEVEIYKINPAYRALSDLYTRVGQYQKSADAARMILSADPNDQIGLSAIALDDLALQNFSGARQIIQQAQARSIENYFLHMYAYTLGFLQSDSTGMTEQQQWFATHPGYESYGLALAADTEAYFGHLKKARELTIQASDFAVRADNKEDAAMYRANAALREAAYGNVVEARQFADEALELSPGNPNVAFQSGLAFAMTGESKRAASLVQELNQRFPLQTQMQLLGLPAIEAQLQLVGRKPDLALNVLRPGLPIEFANATFSTNNTSCLYPTYMRSQAYLAVAQGTAAASEFQKIIDHNGIVWNCWTGAVAHLGMARAYALQARTTRLADGSEARVRALAAYNDFLTLWKDADPDIPILKQAKSEYAKLQ